MSSVKRLGVIPARGGSKRVPNKNIRMICGKPIIHYIIETSLEAEIFDKITVSSDSQEILNLCSHYPIETQRLRPSSLSTDFVSIAEVLAYEYELNSTEYGDFDEVWFLSATACLIQPRDLKNAANKFIQSGSFQAILATVEYGVSPLWAMSENSGGLLVSKQPEMLTERSQDLEKFFHDAGCFAGFKSAVFKTYGSAIPSDIFQNFEIDKLKGIDVDSELDLQLVEAIKHKQQSTSTNPPT